MDTFLSTARNTPADVSVAISRHEDTVVCEACIVEWEELLRDKRSANDLKMERVWCPVYQKAHEGDGGGVCQTHLFMTRTEYQTAMGAHVPLPRTATVLPVVASTIAVFRAYARGITFNVEVCPNYVNGACACVYVGEESPEHITIGYKLEPNADFAAMADDALLQVTTALAVVVPDVQVATYVGRQTQ